MLCILPFIYKKTMNILCIHIVYCFIACLLLCNINQVFTLHVLNYNNGYLYKNLSFSIPLYKNLFQQKPLVKKGNNYYILNQGEVHIMSVPRIVMHILS